MTEKIKSLLQQLYPTNWAKPYEKIVSLLADSAPGSVSFSEKDVMLICYGDHIQKEGEKPLLTMYHFVKDCLPGINRIHFLPFFPYSSDDGFSVIDYYAINPKLGSWSDVQTIAKDYPLMFDFVCNHISSQSVWFTEYLKGNEKYKEYFLSFDTVVDTTSVFRPRTHPLLTPFETALGKKYVWTTFSEDQIDLNYANPAVLVEMVKVLLFYISQGAQAIRLDAIAYIWKKLGSSSLHEKESYLIVQLFRAVCDIACPSLWIISETNLTHKENVSYLDKTEANLVYDFTLPPLLLHSFLKGDASVLSTWAKTLVEYGEQTTYFNFTASHDGIGVTPLNGIVSDDDILSLATHIATKGGHVNYRSTPVGDVPYELNIVYKDAFSCEEAYLASQAIMLALRGVPGIYLNSLIGVSNWHEGVASLGYHRAINRKKCDDAHLRWYIKEGKGAFIYSSYMHLLSVRSSCPLFSPAVAQEILDYGNSVFVVKRFESNSSIVCVTNITSASVTFPLDGEDLLSGSVYYGEVELEPYQSVWLKQPL